jgi:AcrR family transcriptional regulator
VLTRERTDQKRRTRQDLLQAATRLMKRGGMPTLAEVAQEALVSRPTAYRYFSSEKALLQEASLHSVAPTPEQLFADDPSTDPIERLLKADAALHEVIWGNQTQFRLMLARLLDETAKATGVPAEPVRQNRRMDLIEAALSPVRNQFDKAVYRTLCAALALVFGTESMVVFRDVLQMDDPEASEVESWAVQVLARAALVESNRSSRSNQAKDGAGKPKKSHHK